MEPQIAMDIGRHALITAFWLSFPLLCVGLVVGVSISILQAVTQIQEMTLTFVPKLIAMAVAAVLFMPWIMEQIMTFARQMFGPIAVP